MVSIQVLGVGQIQAKGGEGIFNDGGAGGAMLATSYRNLSITKTCELDASFSVPVFAEDLGDLGLQAGKSDLRGRVRIRWRERAAVVVDLDSKLLDTTQWMQATSTRLPTA